MSEEVVRETVGEKLKAELLEATKDLQEAIGELLDKIEPVCNKTVTNPTAPEEPEKEPPAVPDYFVEMLNILTSLRKAREEVEYYLRRLEL